MADAAATVGKRIDGKQIAADIREEIRVEVAALKEQHGAVPGLATVLVGSRKDSQTYVRMKKKACATAGIEDFSSDLPEDITEEDLLAIVDGHNSNPAVNGILVQLPLPKHINEQTVLDRISLAKDVDGFHPQNIGMLCMASREPLAKPCTPKGCVELLDRCGIEISGKRAVVLGRSNIVGLPVAMLLQKRNATVTIVHSRTKDIPSIVQQADIVVAAIGRTEMVKADWIKPGAVIIDVGINSVDDASKKAGYRLVGDVDFAECSKVASWITPVPGGVGPMTIAMLLSNTVELFKRSLPAAKEPAAEEAEATAK